MRVSDERVRWLSAFLIALCLPAAAAFASTSVPPAGDFSPAFLGMYRKTIEIDGPIDRYSRKYGIDPQLARAVCMFESGGNPHLTSGAGARGYFQVMPSTFRLMRVPTNIEAGIKYLSQLVRQFGREDYALAGYNGGPGRVARGRGMPLESLQYVLGVGYYRSVLKMYEPAIRVHASALRLAASHRGDDWAALAGRLHVPALFLRLSNPFVTDARLRKASYAIAYPADPPASLLGTNADGGREYRARIGDNYITLAFAFGVGVDQLRDANGLWRLQVLPADMILTIPSAATDAAGAVAHAAAPEVEHASAAPAERAAPLRLRTPPARRHATLHRVRHGETLTALARRYGTSVSEIQRANRLGRRTVIRVGQHLRIPVR